MANILIVDDEPDLVRLLEFNLKQEGFAVHSVGDGESALTLVDRIQPDLVLLDLMLPDISGLEVCKQLKANPRSRDVPILILTAKGEEVDRVVGFQLGADDYVVKPFSVREVVLRVKALLRRRTEPGLPARQKIGPIELDAEAHRCFVEGRERSLTALEFRLLSTFIQRLGRVQTRQTLLTDVWELSAESQTRTVDTHVKRLREKLGPAGDLIETVRGIGYRMVSPGGDL